MRIGAFNNIKTHTHINIQLIFKRNMTLETTAGYMPAERVHTQAYCLKGETTVFELTPFTHYAGKGGKATTV